MTKKTKLLRIFLPLLLFIGAGGWYVWHDVLHKDELTKKGAGPQVAEQYVCPMHPFIVKDRPGSCPICGMQLVKKGAAGGSDPNVDKAIGQVMLSPTQQMMANVATVEVTQEPLSKDVAAVGIVQFDQARQAKVTAWVAGRLDRLFVNKVGDYVSQGRAVASVYSPDLVSAQQEYLLALRARDQFKASPVDGIAAGGESLLSSARQRLKLLGVKDAQIAALEKGGSAGTSLNIYTPVSGVVIEKMVQQGQYVNVGEPLFSVADLSSVWVELEVYENEFPFIKTGQKVEIVSQSYPGKTFTGTVSYIYPFLDPKTRTVKVRTTLANPGTRLKPDMFVNAVVKSPIGRSVVVPVTAVMDTGKRQVAWVEVKTGTFEPREVKIGARVGDKLQVLSGLKPGEKVAASGGYLIDSESQLSGGSGADHSQHTGQKPAAAAPGGAAGHEGHGTQPAKPGTKGDLNMDDMKM